MSAPQRLSVERGHGRYVIENALPQQLDGYYRQAMSGLERLLAAEVEKQMGELKAAWPKPPSKWVVRVNGDRRYRKWLKRTGKSEAAFYMDKYARGEDIVYTINNDHVGEDGFSYVWVVHTYEMNMDGRSGKMTRAWHFFRERAVIEVQSKLIDRASRILQKELK